MKSLIIVVATLLAGSAFAAEITKPVVASAPAKHASAPAKHASAPAKHASAPAKHASAPAAKASAASSAK